MTEFVNTSGFVTADDAKIYYEVHKSSSKNAPLLILLHGNSEDMHIFDERLPRLLEYYNVITVDARGHGKSSRGTQELSYELFARDLFALVNELHIGTSVILGFSDGANTALQFAIGHQERVAAMILVGGNLNPDGLTAAAKRSITFSAASSGIRSAFSKDKKKRKELMDLMLNHPHIDLKRLEKVMTPTLVISGERDMVRDEHSKLIATTLKNARHVVIPNATHFVMIDNPEEFDRLVIEFLLEDE